MQNYDENMKPAKVEEILSWYDAKFLKIGGKGWVDTEKSYDRLPARAEKIVRPEVWGLSRASAGIRIHFKTDTPTLAVRWDGYGAFGHMPASGISGVDLYVRTRDQWRWLAVGIPKEDGKNESLLFSDLPKEEREFILYLPLYKGVDTVMLGISHQAKISATSDFGDVKPIEFYGTSITQGGCASRAGMAYPAILGRWLHLPTINLGFSGNGKVEPEMIDLICELRCQMIVLDNLPNIEEPLISERLPIALEKIRAKHADIPVVMIESINYCDGFLKASRHKRYITSNEAYRRVFENCKNKGDKNLYYVEVEHLIGDDGEATVDGTHLTDLGFHRFASAIFPLLKQHTSQ